MTATPSSIAKCSGMHARLWLTLPDQSVKHWCLPRNLFCDQQSLPRSTLRKWIPETIQ